MRHRDQGQASATSEGVSPNWAYPPETTLARNADEHVFCSSSHPLRSANVLGKLRGAVGAEASAAWRTDARLVEASPEEVSGIGGGTCKGEDGGVEMTSTPARERDELSVIVRVRREFESAASSSWRSETILSVTGGKESSSSDAASISSAGEGEGL